MTSFRERMINAAASVLSEGVESSKDMISNNVTSFDQMGMANTNPGEFADGEITDKQNLVNTAEMSNDTSFEAKVTNPQAGESDSLENLMSDLVDISVKEPMMIASKTVEIDDNCPECEHEHHHHHHGEFEESCEVARIVNRFLGGKTCLEYLLESDYPGPRDWNPDMRINTANVLNTLKNEIGEGSEAIHVDQVLDQNKNNAYKVSQIDPKLLPKKLQVETVLFELDGDTYKLNKPSETFPLAK